MALQPFDLVFLEQEGDAAGQLLDRLGLLAVHRIEIELDLAQFDAELGERPGAGFLEQLGGVEQGL